MKKKNMINYAQIFCFCLISLTMEFAVWETIPMTSAMFAVSCVGIFVLNIFVLLNNYRNNTLKKTMPEYITIIIWSVIMIIAYNAFYHVQKTITFLFFTMDSYAIFFVRLLISVLPCMFFVDFNEIKETKLFKFLFIVIIAFNTFFTFRAVRVYPDAIRARKTMEYWGEEELLFGTPGYAMIYGMAICFPVLLQKCKSAPAKSFDKWMYIICTVMVAYMIIVSQYATALIITILGTFLFAILNMKPYRKIGFVFTFVFAVLFIRLTGIDVMLLNSLAESVNGTWAEKLHDLAETFSSGMAIGSVEGRGDLYTLSLQAFKESPFFGKMLRATTRIGGHATAIDILGLAGLIGFIPFILTILFNFKRIKNTCDYNKNKSAIIACTVEFLFLVFSKNIITSLPIFFAFFVLVPFLLKLKNEEYVD